MKTPARLILCTAALVLSVSGDCLGSIRGCLLVGLDGGCRVCDLKGGFARSGSGLCVRTALTNCELVDAQENCLGCFGGFKPVGGLCKYPPKGGCLVSSPSGSCLVCQSELYPAPSGKCVEIPKDRLIANCLVYSGLGVCARCAPGFSVVDNACAAMPANCAVRALPYACRGCPANSFLVASPVTLADDFWAKWFNYENYGVLAEAQYPACAPNADPNCLVALSPDACDTCADGLYLTEERKCARPSADIPHCRVFSDATTCADCGGGYFLSGNQCSPVLSVKDIDQCLHYSSATTCKRCRPHFYLQSPTLCSPVEARVDNCDVYDSGRDCKYCAQNFLLLNNACFAFANAECDQYAQASASNYGPGCRFCKPGFRLDAGLNRCVAASPIAHCLYYAPDGSCARCDALYFPADDGRSCQLAAETTRGCSFSSAPSACLACVEGFDQRGGQCRPADFAPIPGCQTYAGGGCFSCETGMRPGPDGKCHPLPVPNCLSGFMVDSFDLVFCRQCKQNHYFSLRSCTPYSHANKDPNCWAAADAQGLCAQCVQGFYLNAASGCAKAAPVDNCFSYEDSKCARCKDGFYLDQPAQLCRAQRPISNCAATLNSPDAGCFQCKEGFVLIKDSCAPDGGLIERCAIYKAGGCLACEPGHALSEDLQACAASQTKPPANCLGFTATRCAQCFPGRAPSRSGECVRLVNPIGDCLFFSAASTCLFCREGFYLENNRCAALSTPAAASSPRVEHCQHYGAGQKCVECAAGFALLQNACAPAGQKPWPAGCLHAGADGACEECVAGLALQNAACVSLAVSDCDVARSVPASGSSPAQAQCLACKSGYFPNSSFSCVLRAGLEHCTKLSSAQVCVECEQEFYASDGSCLPADQIGGCEVHLTNTQCKKCRAGFALSTNLKACVANCETAGDTACTRCAAGFFLNAGACAAAAPLAGCSRYASAAACEKCGPGFLLASPTQCQAVPALSTCGAVALSSSACEVCAPGFAPAADGGCAAVKAPVEGCLAHDQTDPAKCLLCQFGYYQRFFGAPCVLADYFY